MDQHEYSKFIAFVRKYLKDKNIKLDPQEVVHSIVINTGCTKIPPYLECRIVDILREEYGQHFGKFNIRNTFPLQQKDESCFRTSIDEFETNRDVNAILNRLDPRRAKIMRLYLHGYFGSEIAEMENITESRVHQLLRDSIEKIKKSIF